MLQQTQVKTVIPYWERWLRELPTIEALAKASPDKIHKLWEGLGYYTRVRNMQKAAQQIVATEKSPVAARVQATSAIPSPGLKATLSRSDGARGFPTNFDAVLALPGIGRYTAGAICSIAFNQPTPILDGNVIRVLTRVYGITTDPREKQTNAQLWQLAAELVSHAKDAEPAKESNQNPLRPSRPLREENSCSHLNQSLMELGALICTPRSPNCAACPVHKLCIARKENLQAQLPNLAKREAPTERRFLAFVVERHGKFLVRQRPAGVVNAHLWEFPNVEVTALGRAQHSVRATAPQTEAGPQRTDAPDQPNEFRVTTAKPLCSIKHSITRYRITLDAWRAELTFPPKAPGSAPARSKTTNPLGRSALPGEWRTLAQLHQLAFTSAHKKILLSLKPGQ
jgi:A/G-specific adenine glycosylase